MAARMTRLASGTALGLMAGIGLFSTHVRAQEATDEVQDLGTVMLSAEEQVKQSLGVSTITADDIAKTPVANDISEIVRKMPGVNLTGASATGQRGNQRQIDLRGMGPENTLILIDGKPVLSRNAVRMGRAGERDTRGDSNWVPAEMIESIEVIRGPAAARYGSGAAGGVVNIITKRPSEPTYSVGLRYNSPESGLEGGDRRANFMIAQPMGEKLSFRLTGNYNKSDADDPLINAAVDDSCEGETGACLPAAGMEGVVNKDINALLAWEIDEQNQLDFEFGYGRQGNIFAGDRQLTSVNETLTNLADEQAETNVMRRKTFSLTHKGDYDFGTSNSYLQYENTRNTRNLEATAGGPEGSINSLQKGTSVLKNITAKSEWILPTQLLGRETSLTLGAEARYEKMDDPVSIRQAVNSDPNASNNTIPGVVTKPEDRPTEMSQVLFGLYAEANILWDDRLTLTPALRMDHSDSFGFNLSPSLNAAYRLSDTWTMKMGVGRAFKAPNLFQLNPNYVYYTAGNGCPVGVARGAGCYVVGDENLKAEKSLNTEIGFAYENESGTVATITAFHNDYTDKIQSGMNRIGTFNGLGGRTNNVPGVASVFRWENVPEAVVAGVEGSFAADLSETVNFSTNFTYMAKSENKQNGQPLSLVPKYTINAALNWDVTETVTLTPSLTHYGKIDAATVNPTTGDVASNTDSRPAYTLVNLGMTWQMTEGAQLSAGVTNLFDKEILREGSAQSAGANTYNEPGRAFYVGVNASF